MGRGWGVEKESWMKKKDFHTHIGWNILIRINERNDDDMCFYIASSCLLAKRENIFIECYEAKGDTQGVKIS